MSKASLDLETRSALDLKVVGVDVYARHPSTDVLIASYKIDDGPVRRWTRGQRAPADLLDHVENGGTVDAWNAAFELAIWQHVLRARKGWPELKPEQCRCTMARSYAMAMPGALENAAPAAGISEQKDAAGKRLMLQMCKPRTINPDGTYVWWETPEQMDRLGAYCDTDVLTEDSMGHRLMQLSASEQAIWLLDQKINNRGVYVDRPAIEAAIKVVQYEADRHNVAIREVTGNYVGFTSEVARLTEWVRSRGVAVEGLAKADVLDALKLDGLPDDVRRALLIRQEAGKTSTAKLAKMLSSLSADGRLKGMFAFHGAGTGRWAGRKVQLHNLPRPKLTQDEIEDVLDELPAIVAERGAGYAATWIDNLYGSPLDVFSWALRGLLTAAPGFDLIGGDFANIEGRVLAWLAGEQWKLDAFRAYDEGTGPDLYLLAYSKGFHTTIDAAKPFRQVGKVMELALGFQGGVGAFQQMAKTYNVVVSDAQADQLKNAWRGIHPAVVQFWYDLEQASMDAMYGNGQPFSAGAPGRQVTFKQSGSFLWCRLPSGRVLCYPYPKVKAIETPWGEMKPQIHYMTVDGVSNKWTETHTYGGKLAENVTQAVARDLLAAAMLRVEAAGCPIVLHVHDEIVGEIKETTPARAIDEFKRLMAETPPWASGLPVAVEAFRRRRYGK